METSLKQSLATTPNINADDPTLSEMVLTRCLQFQHKLYFLLGSKTPHQPSQVKCQYYAMPAPGYADCHMCALKAAHARLLARRLAIGLARAIQLGKRTGEGAAVWQARGCARMCACACAHLRAVNRTAPCTPGPAGGRQRRRCSAMALHVRT